MSLYDRVLTEAGEKLGVTVAGTRIVLTRGQAQALVNLHERETTGDIGWTTPRRQLAALEKKHLTSSRASVGPVAMMVRGLSKFKLTGIGRAAAEQLRAEHGMAPK